MATRVRTYDILATAAAVAQRLPNLFSLEMWGGATFDTSLRFLHEDPWARLREIRELVPSICFQMLLRGANAVGYASYPDNVIKEFVRESFKQGIDIFRIFDSLNSIDNMRVSIDAAIESGGICEAAICYTGGHPSSDSAPEIFAEVHVTMAKQLEKLGAHFLAVKDMAGLCKPYAAYELVKALKEEIEIPIHFHTHDTSGLHAATRVLKAMPKLAWTSPTPRWHFDERQRHQPAQSQFDRHEALRHTPRDTQLDIDDVQQGSRSPIAGRVVAAPIYEPFDSGPKAGSARLYQHEIPGGQYTNLREQA